MRTTAPHQAGAREPELQRAIREWIAASRRTYRPSPRPGDEQAESAAWRRVQDLLARARPGFLR